MDNFEQVASAGPEITELLSTCPALKVLVTSRQLLHLTGEHIYSVPPMTTPGKDIIAKDERTVSAMTQYESVRLFVERRLRLSPIL